MLWAKQSTAVTVIVGPILDSTGAEYASAVIGDMSISKNGGTLTAMASTATLTYIANGMYTLVTRTTDLDTLGRCQVTCNKSTYQMPKQEFMVLPATVFDALVTNATNTTGGLPAATGAIAGLAGTIATTTNITAATGVVLSSAGVQAIWDALTSALTVVGSIGKLFVDNINATISSRSTYAGGDTSGTSTLLTRIIGTLATGTHNPQSGDAFARIGSAGAGLTSLGDTRITNLDATVSSRSSQTSQDTGFTNTNNLITALNNLSAKMNIFGAPLLEIPDSGSTVYAFTVVVRDDEDKLVNLDSAPTIAAANAAGTSRSANLSVVSSPSTGRYTFTYTVASTHAKESLRITVSGAVSSEARYIEWIGAVVDYDTLTTLQDVQTKAADIQSRLPAALIGGRMSSQVGAMGTDVLNATVLAADAATEIANACVTQFGLTPPDVNVIEMGGNTIENQVADNFHTWYANNGVTLTATQGVGQVATINTNVTTLTTRITSTLFSGITSLADWIRRIVRKDSGSAGMIAAEAEIDTGGTSTFTGTTDNLEAIKDAGGGGGGGGTVNITVEDRSITVD